MATTPPRIWGSRILLGLTTAFFLMDGGIHLAKPAPVVEAFQKLGYPIDTALGIGGIELLCLALYLIPQTAVLGAVLLTGVLGGAVAAHVRVGDPAFPTWIFPVLVGLMIWGALVLQDQTLRASFPLRRTSR